MWRSVIRRVCLGLGLVLVLSGSVFAAEPTAPSAPQEAPALEASMLAIGTIEVDADGRVARFELIQRQTLPAKVVALIDRSVPQWRFEPHRVDGAAVPTHRDMSLRIVARPDAQGEFTHRISGATFGAFKQARDRRPSSLQPPPYPPFALEQKATGMVYVLLKLDHDGRVQDAVVEQVNLSRLRELSTADALRSQLADAVLRTARTWRLAIDLDGDWADKPRPPFLLARVPVHFVLGSSGTTTGRWEGYLRGPWTLSPWFAQIDDERPVPPDTYPEGGIYLHGSGLKLLTPLE